MNKSSFIKTLKEPAKVDNDLTPQLETLTENFPYFQLGHQLVSKNHSAFESSLSNEKLKTAAIYTSSRKKLRQLVVDPFKKPIGDKTSEKNILPVAKLELSSLKTIENKKQARETVKSEEATKQYHVEKLIIPEILKKEFNISKTKKGEVKIDVTPTAIVPSPVIETKTEGETKIKEVVLEKKESKLDFKKNSSIEYFSSDSNVNLDNLIPEVSTYKLENAQSSIELLIPDGLGMVFGITDSRLGETILSEEVLKTHGIGDLISPNVISQPIHQKLIIDDFLDNLPNIKIKLPSKVALNQNTNLAKKK